jgi:hypothetical protein
VKKKSSDEPWPVDSKKLQPIIIKRVKKGGHAVHGGAWKIAYADFVTAMMAFFLLMWLLGSTTEGDRKALPPTTSGNWLRAGRCPQPADD